MNAAGTVLPTVCSITMWHNCSRGIPNLYPVVTEVTGPFLKVDTLIMLLLIHESSATLLKKMLITKVIGILMG